MATRLEQLDIPDLSKFTFSGGMPRQWHVKGKDQKRPPNPWEVSEEDYLGFFKYELPYAGSITGARWVDKPTRRDASGRTIASKKGGRLEFRYGTTGTGEYKHTSGWTESTRKWVGFEDIAYGGAPGGSRQYKQALRELKGGTPFWRGHPETDYYLDPKATWDYGELSGTVTQALKKSYRTQLSEYQVGQKKQAASAVQKAGQQEATDIMDVFTKRSGVGGRTRSVDYASLGDWFASNAGSVSEYAGAQISSRLESWGQGQAKLQRQRQLPRLGKRARYMQY